MAAESLLAKLGCRLTTLGAAASLAFAFPLSEGDPSFAAHTAAGRIGTYADRTGGAEKVGHVVMGTEVLSVGVSSITAAVKIVAPATTTAAAGLNLGQGTAPTSPNNGDVWITASGTFARVAGTTVGPFGVGTLTGTLTSGRVPFANGAASLTDSSTFTFSTTNGLSVNRPNTTGSEFFGSGAGNTSMTGQRATYLGNGAGAATTSASDNTAVGNGALALATTSGSNTAIGSGAGANLIVTTTADLNTFVGYSAGGRSRGATNVAIGTNALNGSVTPASNTGASNIAIGYFTLSSITTDTGNTAVGMQALTAQVGVGSANSNTAVGYFAGSALTTANQLVLVGYNAGASLTSQAACTFVGWTSGNKMQGGNNTALGANAMFGSGTASSNTGTNNVAIGTSALAVITSDSDNIAVGSSAMVLIAGSSGKNIAVGSSAMAAATAGSLNTIIGHNAGSNQTTANSNTFIGANCGLRMFNGGSNVAIGSATLVGSATASNNTGASNTVVGTGSLAALTTASNNCVLGANSGTNISTGTDNVIIGKSSGTVTTTGSFNIFIGNGAGDSAVNSASNVCIIGSVAGPITTLYLGNGQTAVTPAGTTISATGGSGANIAGASLTIAGGDSTGTGLGGNVIIQVSPAGAGGGSLNPLVTGLTVNQRKTVDLAFGLVAGIRTTTTTDTAVNTDFTILGDTTSGGYTQSLMAAPATGFVINVKKIAAANTLTISGNGKNIDGSATLAVTTLNQSTMLQYDGTQWRIL